MVTARMFAPLVALTLLEGGILGHVVFADDVSAVSKKIDAAILEQLDRAKIRPAPRADHPRLVRRIYLDVLGRIPTADETRVYLDDSRPDKHHRLIDSLVTHPEFSVAWRKFLDSWFNGPYDRQTRGIGHEEFLSWLQRSIESKKSWDSLARELILPKDADAQQKGASYFLTSRMRNDREVQIDNLATGFASGLFGVQLQCAKCHDHPFVDAWKQDHYYGLATFFARVDPKNVGNDKDASEVKFATRKKGEKTASAMFLDSVVLDPAGDPKKNAGRAVNRRQLLVDHALKPESPYFKRSFVNRMWKQLMGRGLVEPVDQIHDANPASHPELLNWLADDFAANRFAIERTLLGILHSDAYLRDSRIDASPRPGDETYAASVLKPLSGEQMAWSMVVASGYADVLAKKFAKDVTPPKVGDVGPSLRMRWEKDVEFDAVIGRFRSGSEAFQANVSQALFATFNPFAKKLIEPKGNPYVQRLAAEKDDRALARTAYLAVLSRFPTDAEADDVVAYFRNATDRNAAVGDLLWSLMTTAEFRFNH
jgi:hypothetical protein